jgi:mRNA interferase MazF
MAEKDQAWRSERGYETASSDNAMNSALKTIVVCPLKSELHPEWCCRVQVKVNGKDSEITVDHIRSTSKERLHSEIGNI